MAKKILPFIEGQSEEGAIPVLLRRFISRIGAYDVQIDKPWRVKRDQIVYKVGVLENKLREALIDRDNVSGVLLILDADEDCPKQLGPNLLKRCNKETHLPVSVILAKKKLECWFLGAKESLRGVRGIKANAVIPDNPESLGIGRLENNLEAGSYYHKVDDAPAFAARMDIDKAAKNCPSFKRFIRETERLIEACQE
ncbi:MAG: DUF4276 family protein [Candidatus Hatepunaea meridiana]|nr:DUF4276 family protein [Candidatus Hatepunaea meridiana]